MFPQPYKISMSAGDLDKREPGPATSRPIYPGQGWESLRGFGAAPIMNAGLTFSEIGNSGLRQYSGWVREEYLPQLVGQQGAAKYREMMDSNATIGAIMFSIVSTMRKVEWRVQSPTDSPGSQEAVEFVESLRDDMSHTWEDLIVENLSMLGYGYAPHEIVYKRRLGLKPRGADPQGQSLPSSKYDDGKIGWRRIPLRGQETVLKWFFDPNGQVTGMTQQPFTGPPIDLPIEKMLLFRPSAHKGNPEGRSILRTAFRSYYFVKRLEEAEAILFERLNGIPVIKVPGALIEQALAGDPVAVASMNMYRKIATSVRIDEQMGIILPSDVFQNATGSGSVEQYTIELVTPASGKMSVSAHETIGRYNVAMMTSVLADFLQLGHEARGTQSLAVSKVDLFFLAIEGYLNSMAAVYNRYALPRLFDLNGMDRESMPEFVPDLAQRLDLDVLGNFVVRMSQAGMPLFPDDELQTFLRDSAGMPDTTDQEALDFMMDNAAAASAMGDPGGEDIPPEGEEGNDGNGQPKRRETPVEKMVKAAVMRRQIKLAGPRYGISTRKRGRPRKTPIYVSR